MIMRRLRSFSVLAVLVTLGSIGGVACGDRPDVYDAAISAPQTFALEDQVALLDGAAERVVLLKPGAEQTLDRSAVRVGKKPMGAQVSPDRKRLFVLTAGDVPRRKEHDERAALSVIENGAARRFDLESAHSGFVIDPLGRYAALYAAPTRPAELPPSFVENPNEIVIVDLQASPENAITPRTLRSFGGRPQRVTFTEPLALPGGTRRLLVVETDQDLQLLDLDNVRAVPRHPEITVRLTNGTSATALKPTGIAVHDGEPNRNDDARVGIRVEGSTSVFTLTLVPQKEGAVAEEPGTIPNDFRPELNLTDVGGTPSDLAFVRTDVGVRLAAVVPSIASAVLVDPATSLTQTIKLPQSYGKVSLITNVVSDASGTDTALLYGASGSNSGVAFWSLGRSTSQTYRTVEVVSLATQVDRVLDVPPPRPELKVLSGNAGAGFFVLNLASRTAAPLTTTSSASLHLSPDGQRIWVYGQNTSNLAQVTLADLHPVQLPLDRDIAAVHDVARSDGGRSLVVIDTRGGVGATVLDALAPDTATSRSYYGLFLENL